MVFTFAMLEEATLRALLCAFRPDTPIERAPKRDVIVQFLVPWRFAKSSVPLCRLSWRRPPFCGAGCRQREEMALTAEIGTSIGPITSCGVVPERSISETTPAVATLVCTAEPSAALALTVNL